MEGRRKGGKEGGREGGRRQGDGGREMEEGRDAPAASSCSMPGATLQATQGQIISQSPTDAISSRGKS